MGNIEKLHELLDMALCVQMHGHGVSGYPMVVFETSNYGKNVSIRIVDNGFDNKGDDYDGLYEFSFGGTDSRTYKNCKEHLRDLIKSIEAVKEGELNAG